MRGLLSCSHGGEDVSETSLLLVEERSERDDDLKEMAVKMEGCSTVKQGRVSCVEDWNSVRCFKNTVRFIISHNQIIISLVFPSGFFQGWGPKYLCQMCMIFCVLFRCC